MATITGDGGDNDLQGGINDDTISGLGGADTLTGAGGNDSLVGGTGDDLLVGDGGNGTTGNLISNGTFEDSSAWTVVDGNSDGQVPLFLQDLVIFNAGGRPVGDSISQSFDSANGAVHNVSLDLIENDPGIASHTFTVQIFDDQGNIITSQTQGVGDSGTVNLAFSFTAVSDTSTIVITNTAFSGDTNGSDGKVDNVSITLDDPTVVGNSDTLEGDAGEDTLLGGEGDDQLDGGADDDAIFGGDGADSILGGTGADTIDGDAGNDTIDGGDGTNFIQGGAGGDQITAGVDADTISGGIGDDSLVGGDGADSIIGGDDDDTIEGGAGNDFIDGDGNGDIVHVIQEESFENPTFVVEGADSFANSFPAGTSPLENFAGTSGFFRDSSSAPQFPNAIAADDGTFYSGLHSDGGSFQEVVSLQLDQPLEAGEDHTVSFLAHVMIHGGVTPGAIFQQPGSFSIMGVSADSTASNAEIAPLNGTTSAETIAAHPDVDLLGTTPIITSSTDWNQFIIEFTAGRSYDQILFVPNDEGNGQGSFLGIDDIQLTTELTDDTDLGALGQGGDDSIDAGDGDDTVIGNFGDDTIQGGAGNDSLQGDGGDANADAVIYTPPASGIFSYATGGNLGNGISGGTNHAANVADTDVSGLTLTLLDGNRELVEGEVISFSFTDENGAIITVDSAVVQQTAFANAGIEGTGVLTAQGVDQNGEETALLLQFNDNAGNPPVAIAPGGTFFDNDTEPDAFNGTNITVPTADLSALSFDDSISGGDDNDTIDGQFGDDTLAGDGGDDIFFATTGTDAIDGGAGIDTFDVTSTTTLNDGVSDTTEFRFDDGDLGFRTFDQNLEAFQNAQQLIFADGNPNITSVDGDIANEFPLIVTPESFESDQSDLIGGTINYSFLTSGANPFVGNSVFIRASDGTTIVAQDTSTATSATITGGSQTFTFEFANFEFFGGGVVSEAEFEAILADIEFIGIAADQRSGNENFTVDDIVFTNGPENLETINTTVSNAGDGTVVKTEDGTTDTVTSVETFIADESTVENDTITLTDAVERADIATSITDLDNNSVGVFTPSNGGAAVAFGGLGEPTLSDLLAGTFDPGTGVVNPFGSFQITDGDETGQIGAIAFQNFETINFDVVCFTKGVRIETPAGDVPVESLSVGDLVHTQEHGPQPIRWIGRKSVLAAGRHAPVEFKANSIGNKRPFRVSQQHRMLVTNQRLDMFFGTPSVLVPAKFMCNGRGIEIVEGGEVEYFHILFDRHEVVFAEGVPSESFHPGHVGLKSLNAAACEELLHLFPEMRTSSISYGPCAFPVLKRHEWAAFAPSWHDDQFFAANAITS